MVRNGLWLAAVGAFGISVFEKLMSNPRIAIYFILVANFSALLGIWNQLEKKS